MKRLHQISFAIGLFFLVSAIFQAFLVTGAHFYTAFTLGSWLVLDYFDFLINKSSILAYFFNHKHRHAFFLFFLISFIFCFVVDYLWGVRVLRMWEWINYGPTQFVRMYLIMNATFILSMYELFRLAKTFLRNRVPNTNLLHLIIPETAQREFYQILLFLGFAFLAAPIVVIIFRLETLKGFIMLLPFAAVILIPDAITFLKGGRPVLHNLFRFNALTVSSLSLTVIIAVVITEGINLVGKEWKYLQMPFPDTQVANIPITVFLGWIPLVIGTICIVNLIKHLKWGE